jgi:hypothetical protein
MKSSISYLFLLTLIIYFSCKQEKPIDPKQASSHASQETAILLEKISPEQSGIYFNNQIKENERLHCFIWNFIYQGAGVGIADINNDGLPDIYLCGNMVGDKLYLNKGDFQFEDISEQAGITNRLWSTGVNFVDINEDGFLDIYVCKNFFLLQESVRQNKLYINNGDLSFTESAQSYGIADDGFSIQSYFFDADNDGDLDMYLVNQPMDQYAARLARPENLARLPFSDKFYLNVGKSFVDKTAELGFVNKAYGLSAIPADLNMDGWTDLYLCNDYQHGDNLFINKGQLKFEDQIKNRLGHSSFYSMGSDVDDINCDGQPDFISLDMAFEEHYRSKTNMESMRPELFNRLAEEGHHFQYPVNTLQLNQGDGYFSDIAHYAGISHSDWSWSALFADLNLDAYPDLLVTNGILRDLRNNDFVRSLRANNGFSVNNSNFRSIIEQIPSTPVANKLYMNLGNNKFESIGHKTAFGEPGFSSGMAMGDLDNDGDLDIVVNNTNQNVSIFRNNTNKHNNFIKVKLKGSTGKPHGEDSRLVVFFDNKQVSKTINRGRAYMSASDLPAIIGLGKSKKIDSLLVYWNHREYSKISESCINCTITVDYSKKEYRHIISSFKQGKKILRETDILEFNHRENAFNEYEHQVLLPHSIANGGPYIATADINGDKKVDVWLSGASGQSSKLFMQSADVSFQNTNNKLLADLSENESLQAVFFDLENDGDKDIYIVHGGAQFDSSTGLNKDHILVNENGSFSKSIELKDSNIDGQCVLASDFNGDSYVDIFIGGRSVPGKYGIRADSKILLNQAGQLEDKTMEICPELKNIGMVTDAFAEDLDGDGDRDLVVTGEWLPIIIFENKNNKLIKVEAADDRQYSAGWWWALESGDFDNDGDIDFIAGNLGENNKFKPEKEKPLSLYASDLDKNGDHDILLAKTANKQLLPVRGRECSSEEMPFIADKFKSYHDYAIADVKEIHAPEALKESTRHLAYTFSHFYYENTGQFKFKAHKLPAQTQIGAIKSFELIDINEDGYLDFFYTGNHLAVEPETVRYDALSIGLCISDQKNGFNCLSREKLGVHETLDYRDMSVVYIDGRKLLFVSSNNGPLKTFIISGNAMTE